MKSKYGFLVRKQTKIDNGNGTYHYEYSGDYLYLLDIEYDKMEGADYEQIQKEVNAQWANWDAYEVIRVSYDVSDGYRQITNWELDPINPKNRQKEVA